ncbi:Nif3-like dinuclear metal center hexameric protein [Mycoplasma hafezii]|uniref:Nif3-like dinuclear metal center hexameric protein n=1 Tax=Mycoplasma hafezii TaxID=525886 RepID=UPI003CEE4F4E
MKIKDFVLKLQEMYPVENAEEWDPTGYSVKFNQAKKLRGVLLAIDVTADVVNQAIANDCNLIVTHHPFFFEETKELEKEKAPYKFDLYKKLKEYQITVYAMHTNYDCEPRGTSFQIAKYLGLANNVRVNSPKFAALVDHKTTINELSNLIKLKLRLTSFRTNVKFNELNKQIQSFAILSGSGYVGQINELGHQVDLIISSDFRWSDWINFRENNISMLEIPHLDEEVFAYHMFEELPRIFPKVRFFLVKTENPYYNLD